MAVGIIIGAAFDKIVSSFVSDVIMPPVGVLIGGVDFTNLAVVIQEASGQVEVMTIKYGAFLQSVSDFVIAACAIFMEIKIMNNLKKKEEVPEKPAEPSKEEVLLSEIHDALRAD